MRVFKIMASNMHATYRAGEYVAESAAAAIEQAREEYRNSQANRELRDVGSFEFYPVTDWPENY